MADKEVVVDHPAVGALAELQGIFADLMWVENAMKEYVGLGQETDENSRVREALWVASVVRYSRCFNKGVRRPINREWLEGLDEDLRQLHHVICTLRNKHVAHSVNPYEDNYVTMRVPDPIPDDWENWGITGQRSRHYLLSPDDDLALATAQLAETLRQFVGYEMYVEANRIDEVIRKLPVDEVRKWPPVEDRGPRAEDLWRARPRSTGER